jgi:LysM domain
MSTIAFDSSTRVLQPVRERRLVAVGTVDPHARSTVRLTRRGRLVVVALGLLVVLVAGMFLTAGSVATERPGTPEPARIVMVGEGDTLWGLAADAAAATGSDDTRAMIERIERLNALDSGMVMAGQRLRIPTD